jgi:hypothetical protein
MNYIVQGSKLDPLFFNRKREKCRGNPLLSFSFVNFTDHRMDGPPRVGARAHVHLIPVHLILKITSIEMGKR